MSRGLGQCSGMTPDRVLLPTLDPRENDAMRTSLRATAAVIVLAALSFLVYTYYDHHVVTNTGGDLPIGVLVAKTLIHKGTAGNVIAARVLYSVKTLRSSEVPKGAFVDPRALSGEVVQQDIHPEGVLTAAEFSSSASRR
jgi:flagella basal body P-ring formation protein FlgA